MNKPTIRHTCPFCCVERACEGCSHCWDDDTETFRIERESGENLDGAYIPCAACGAGITRQIQQQRADTEAGCGHPDNGHVYGCGCADCMTYLGGLR